MTILVEQIQAVLNLSVKEENSSTLQDRAVFVARAILASNPLRGYERV
jgi:hypothetical protein